MNKLVFEANLVLDESVLEELEGLGDPELLKELHGVFKLTADETLGVLQGAARMADRLLFAEAIHKLKGSSGSMGASALYSCCRVLDLMSKENRISESDMDDYVSVVRHELDRANEAFEMRFSQTVTGGGLAAGLVEKAPEVRNF